MKKYQVRIALPGNRKTVNQVSAKEFVEEDTPNFMAFSDCKKPEVWPSGVARFRDVSGVWITLSPGTPYVIEEVEVKGEKKGGVRVPPSARRDAGAFLFILLLLLLALIA